MPLPHQQLNSFLLSESYVSKTQDHSDNMAMKVEVVSVETIKPSSPTPSHLKSFTISLLDQLAPPFYVPIVLFYSNPHDALERTRYDCNFMLSTLKTSLSKTLSRFYPFCGRLNRNAYVDCTDEGVLFSEARASMTLSEILAKPDMTSLQRFLPFSPYKASTNEDEVVLGVQANVFECGGLALGVCVSHKTADGATVSSFLNAWSSTASGIDDSIKPCLSAGQLFQPKDFAFQMPSGVISKDKIVTKRFHFDGTKLANLRTRVSNPDFPNPTRVEAVTSLIWKTALEAAKTSSGKDGVVPPSVATHVVNIRNRLVPPLPEQAIGNLWQTAVVPLLNIEAEKELQCHDLTNLLRKGIKKIDGDHVRRLQGDDRLAKACESLMAARQLASKGDVELYRFSSWVRFPFYESDFGWGRPAWVCTTSVPMKNVVILMGTSYGDGIEAWISLTEDDMTGFELNDDLLQYVSSGV